MTSPAKRNLKKCLGYFGLQVKYAADLPDSVAGFLERGSDPRYIILNERKSHSDHMFTIAHELAHYVMHVGRPPRNRMPGYLAHPWESVLFREATEMTRNWVQPFFEPEGEADAWAFAFLLRLGAVDETLAVLELYPKKFWVFALICIASIYNGLQGRITTFFRLLLGALNGDQESNKL